MVTEAFFLERVADPSRPARVTRAAQPGSQADRLQSIKEQRGF